MRMFCGFPPEEKRRKKNRKNEEFRLLGTHMPTWGTYEAGTQRIPPDQALKLSAYGIPLGWIYDGKVKLLLSATVQS